MLNSLPVRTCTHGSRETLDSWAYEHLIHNVVPAWAQEVLSKGPNEIVRCFESIILNGIFNHRSLNGVQTDPKLICEIGLARILEDVPQHSLCPAMINRLKRIIFKLSEMSDSLPTSVKVESEVHPWVSTYQKHLASKGGAKRAVQNEQYILAGFLRWLPTLRKFSGVEMAHINLFLLRNEDVKAYLRVLRQRVNSGEIAETTASTQSKHALGFLRFCQKRYGIPDVVRNARGIDAGDTIDRWLPDPTEVQRFFEVIMQFLSNPIPYMTLFGCMYLLGLRPSEAIGIHWERLDLTDMVVEFTAKGGKLHKMPLVEPLQILFFEMRQEKKPRSVYVFEMAEGKAMSLRYDMPIAFRVFAYLAGWPTESSPAVFRHAFCTHLLIEARDYTLVNRLARHKKFSMTERYVHLVEGHYQDAAETIHTALTIPFVGGGANGNSGS